MYFSTGHGVYTNQWGKQTIIFITVLVSFQKLLMCTVLFSSLLPKVVWNILAELKNASQCYMQFRRKTIIPIPHVIYLSPSRKDTQWAHLSVFCFTTSHGSL